MTVNLNLPLIASVLAAVAGSAGTVVTALYGAPLGHAVQAVLVGIAGLLVAIPVHHAASTAAATSRAKFAAARHAQP